MSYNSHLFIILNIVLGHHCFLLVEQWPLLGWLLNVDIL
jgi:hypothetical protein